MLTSLFASFKGKRQREEAKTERGEAGTAKNTSRGEDQESPRKGSGSPQETGEEADV